MHARRARARPACRPARQRHRARRRLDPAARRARGRHDEDAADPRGPSRGSAGVGRARRVQPGPRDGLGAHRLHVRARPVLATGQLDRRQRQHERGRPALPRLRRDLGARARAGRRARRRHAGEDRRRGTGERRIRPPWDRGRFRRHARCGHGGVRAPDADRTRRPHHVAGLREGRGLRRDGVVDRRARSGAGGPRDDGPRDRPRRRGVRARRLPHRCRRRAPGGGRRARGGRRRPGARGRNRGARARRRLGAGRRRRRANARSCGRDASPRSARSRGSRPITTCTTASCHGRA